MQVHVPCGQGTFDVHVQKLTYVTYLGSLLEDEE